MFRLIAPSPAARAQCPYCDRHPPRPWARCACRGATVADTPHCKRPATPLWRKRIQATLASNNYDANSRLCMRSVVALEPLLEP